MCRSEGDAESAGGARPLRGATREARYIDLMRTMQFGEWTVCWNKIFTNIIFRKLFSHFCRNEKKKICLRTKQLDVFPCAAVSYIVFQCSVLSVIVSPHRDVRDDGGEWRGRVPLHGAVPLRGHGARGGRARPPRAHEAPRAGGRHARHLAAALLLLLRVRAHRHRQARHHEGTHRHTTDCVSVLFIL